MGLVAVLGSAVTGEVLDGQGDALELHALGALLVAGNQSGGDAGDDLGHFAVGAGVTGPAGIGSQVDLGAVHLTDTLGDPHFAVHLSVLSDHGVIAAVGNVTHDSSSQSHVVHVAGADGVGDQGPGQDGLAADDASVLSVLVADVVQQSHNRGIIAHVAAVHSVTQAQVQDRSVIGSGEAAHDHALGGAGDSVAASNNNVTGVLHDLLGIDGAVFLGGISQGLDDGVAHQVVEDELGHLCSGQGSNDGIGTLFSGQAPVFEGIQLLVVVGVLEVLAVNLQHANGGDTDGGLAFAVGVNDGLEVDIVNVLALSQGVGSSDVLHALSHCGNHGQDHHQGDGQAQKPLHDAISSLV